MVERKKKKPTNESDATAENEKSVKGTNIQVFLSLFSVTQIQEYINAIGNFVRWRHSQNAMAWNASPTRQQLWRYIALVARKPG